jgi:NaMN:DMB phosphoribosyltransferase
MKTDQELQAGGFTESGAKRYKATATAYCDQLFGRAVTLGESDKAIDAPREVTHEHVRSAAAALAVKGQDRSDPVQVCCQIGEYVCAACAGVGGGKLEHSWGVLMFGISLTLGVILFVVRNSRGRVK